MSGSSTQGETNASSTAALVKRITQLPGTTTSATATITAANTQTDPNYAFFDFSAFDGNATNGAQGGLSPINQPDPNYVSYDFSAFNGNATNGAQGGLSPVNQPDPNYVSYDFSAFNGAAANGSQGGLVPLPSNSTATF